MSDFAGVDLTIVSAAATHGRYRAQLPAVSCGGQTMCWGDLHILSNRIANSLLAAGFRPGQSAAVLLSNRIETIPIYLGILKAGGVIVPLSTAQTSAALAAILRDCKPGCFFDEPSQRNLVDAAVDAGGEMPALQFRISPSQYSGGTSFDGCLPELFRAATGDDPSVRIRPSQDFSIVYTSGTTGEPKGVVHTHSARTAFCVLRALAWRMSHGDRFLTSTPLYHNGALHMVLPALLVGGHLAIMQRFDVAEFCETIERTRIDYAFVVPTQLARLIESRLFDTTDFSSLRVMVSAGAPLSPSARGKLLDRMGHCFAELYGSTEGIGTLIGAEEMRRKPGSVGIPVIGGEICIVDSEDRLAPVGTIGEIVGRAPHLMRGYFNRPTETDASRWRSADGIEYYRSGDLGRLDDDGYLYLTGRKKDMLISGGVNIYPADIEAVLAAHPDVLEVAVVGVPHADWGEVPAAAVVLKEACCTGPDVLREWANERVGRHQRIRHLALVPQLPRTVLGKVLKNEVVQLFTGQNGK